MITRIWKNKRHEIGAISAAAFILLDLWTIKTSEVLLTSNQLLIHGVVLCAFLSAMVLNLYVIQKRKYNKTVS